MHLPPCHSADFPFQQGSHSTFPSHPSYLSQPQVPACGERPSKIDDRRDSRFSKGIALSQSTTRFLPPYVRPFGERKVSGVSVDRSFEIPDTKSVFTPISEAGKRQKESLRKERFVSVCFGLSEERREEQSDCSSDHTPGSQVYSSPLGSKDVRNQTESRNDMDTVLVSNTLPLDAPGKDVASQQPRHSSFYQGHKLGKGRHLMKAKTHPENSDTDNTDDSEYTDKKKRKKRSIIRARVPTHCTFCDAAFDRATDYVRHCETIRHQQAAGCNVPKKTVCDKCGQSFTRLDAMKRHQRKTCLLMRPPGSGILPEEGILYRDKAEMDEPAL